MCGNFINQHEVLVIEGDSVTSTWAVIWSMTPWIYSCCGAYFALLFNI